jgi:hypothetical protein
MAFLARIVFAAGKGRDISRCGPFDGSHVVNCSSSDAGSWHQRPVSAEEEAKGKDRDNAQKGQP